jgi:hypothetical protein
MGTGFAGMVWAQSGPRAERANIRETIGSKKLRMEDLDGAEGEGEDGDVVLLAEGLGCLGDGVGEPGADRRE